MTDLARRVRELRANLGLNQADFAREIGASQSSVSKWESGKETPRSDALQAMFKLAGVNLQSMISGHTDKGLDTTSVYTGRPHSFKIGKGLRTVRVAGSVNAEQGSESTRWPDEAHFDILIPTTNVWGPVKLEGWAVNGRHMWDDYPPGTIIVTASTSLVTDDGDRASEDDEDAFRVLQEVEYEHGDRVLVANRMVNGLLRIVPRKLVVYPDGSKDLWQLNLSAEPPAPPIPVGYSSHDTQILGLIAAVIKFEVEPERLVQIPTDI